MRASTTASGWLLFGNLVLAFAAVGLPVDLSVREAFGYLFLVSWFTSLPTGVASLAQEAKAGSYRVVWPILLLVEWLGLSVVLLYCRLTGGAMIL